MVGLKDGCPGWWDEEKHRKLFIYTPIPVVIFINSFVSRKRRSYFTYICTFHRNA
jgi:hypothetical protein